MFLDSYKRKLDRGRLILPPEIDGVYTLIFDNIPVDSSGEPPYNYLALYPLAPGISGREVGPGRFILGQEEREYLGINKSDEVVVIGMEYHLEIWNQSTYQEMIDEIGEEELEAMVAEVFDQVF